MDVISNYYAGMESVDKLDLCKGSREAAGDEKPKIVPRVMWRVAESLNELVLRKLHAREKVSNGKPSSADLIT